jgi:hypothetical protein
VVEEPRRSPAPREDEVVDWIWEAEKSLVTSQHCLAAGRGRMRRRGRRTWSKQWVVPRSRARIARRYWIP